MQVNKVALAIGVASAVLLMGGCSKKVGGQVVAVVNGQEVTQGELNAELNGQTIPPGADRKAVMAQLLQQIVTRKLLVGRAKDQGLDKSPSYLAQVQRGQDAVLIGMLAANTAKTIAVPDAASASRFMTQNPSLFAGRKRYQLDQIAFAAVPNAALAAKLKAAKSMADVEAALKASSITWRTGTAQVDTASLPPPVAAQIATLPAGEPFLVPHGSEVVANVIRSSEPVPVSPEQAQPAAIELLRRQAVELAMRKQADTARSSATISYAPGLAPPASSRPRQ